MYAKLSILALCIRLFGINQAFKWTCYVTAGIVIFYCLACTPIHILGFLPSGARTFAQIDDGQCVKTIQVNIAIGAIEIATDTVLILLPIPTLLKLELPRGKRVALFVVFATGLMDARPLPPFQDLINEPRTTDFGPQALLDKFDSSKVITPQMARGRRWQMLCGCTFFLCSYLRSTLTASSSTIEINLGILAGCLLVLYPLGQRIAQSQAVQSDYSSLNNRSRHSGRKLSLSWRTSGDSEGGAWGNLKDLNFDGEGKRHH